MYEVYTHALLMLSLTQKASHIAGIMGSVLQIRKFRRIKQIVTWQKAWWCENHLETWASFTSDQWEATPLSLTQETWNISHTHVAEGSHFMHLSHSKQKSNKQHVASVGSLQQSLVKSRILHKFHGRLRQLLEAFGFHEGRHFKTSISFWVNDKKNRVK